MAQKKFLNVFVSLLLATNLVGCASLDFFSSEPEPKVVTETKIVKPNIPLQQKPRPVEMQDIYFFVVTEANFEEFKKKYQEKFPGRDIVIFGLHPDDYEKLAINISELKRYIEQQKSIIVYYESALTDTPTKTEAAK